MMETIKLLALYLEHWIVSWSDETKIMFKPCLLHLIENSAIPFYLKPKVLLHYLKHYSNLDRNPTSTLDLAEMSDQMCTYLTAGHIQNLGLCRVNLSQIGNLSASKSFLTGLYLYDLIFECIWKVCQVLEILRIKTGNNLGKAFKEKCSKVLHELIENQAEQFGIRLIDELGLGVKKICSTILHAILESDYSVISNYQTLHVYLLPFLSQNVTQTFQNDHLFMLLTFETQCHHAQNHVYPYSYHLPPKSEAVFQTSCSVDSKYALRQGWIRKFVVDGQLSGTHDVFGLKTILLTSSPLKSSTLILKITNQTKLFLDEVSVVVTISASRRNRAKTHKFELENFAGLTTKQLRISFSHESLVNVGMKFQIYIPKLQRLLMDYQMNPANQLLPISKIPSLAAIRDVFDVKSVTEAVIPALAAFLFLQPLPLHSLSSVCTQDYLGRLLYVSRQAKLAFLPHGNSPDGTTPVIPPLPNKHTDPLLRNPILVLESQKSRSIYMRTNLQTHHARLEALFSTQTSSSQSSHTLLTLHALMGPSGELVCLSIRSESSVTGGMTHTCVVRSDSADTAETVFEGLFGAGEGGNGDGKARGREGMLGKRLLGVEVLQVVQIEFEERDLGEAAGRKKEVREHVQEGGREASEEGGKEQPQDPFQGLQGECGVWGSPSEGEPSEVPGEYFGVDAFQEEQNEEVEGLINFFAEDEAPETSEKVDFFNWGSTTEASEDKEWTANWDQDADPSVTETAKPMVLDDEIEF